MSGNEWARRDLTTPLADLQERAIFTSDQRKRRVGLASSVIQEYVDKRKVDLENPDEWPADFRALFAENQYNKIVSASVDVIEKLEVEFFNMFPCDERMTNAVAVLVQGAFNCGYMAGESANHSAAQMLESYRAQNALGSIERNRVQATDARRALGDPTRERAREVMKRRPHLSWTACANEIADGRDARGVARIIEELFPKDADGKRRYREG